MNRAVLLCTFAMFGCGSPDKEPAPAVPHFSFDRVCDADVMDVHAHLSAGPGGFDTVTLTVGNSGSTPLRLTSLRASGTGVRDLILPAVGQTIEPGRSTPLTFGYSPSVPTDETTTRITLGVENALESEYSVGLWTSVLPVQQYLH